MIYSENRFDSANRSGEYLKYVRYEPENKTEDKLPLFIYVHGAGGRGDDLSVIKTVAPMGVIAAGREVNAVCVAPQCHADTWFELFETLMDFAESMANESGVDKRRIYLTGVSMGGVCRVAACNDKARYVRGARSCLRRRNVLERRAA